MTGRLPSIERDRLAELEQTIERGLQTFVEVGQALAEIRDGRLYRATHDTFESYLSGRWNISRSRGYRLIDASAVVDALSPFGDIPANEAQARELVPLLRDEGEAAVRRRVCASCAPSTARASPPRRYAWRSTSGSAANVPSAR